LTHPFDIATTLTARSEGRFAGETSPAYWNFAGPFGGIAAALLLRAVLDDPRRQGTPVALTTNYCGAIKSGAFEIELTPERTGRTIQHWSLRLVQGDTVTTTGSVVTALRSESFAHQVAAMPTLPPHADVARAKTPSNLPWLSAYDFRFLQGPAFTPPPAGTLGPSRTLLYMSDVPSRPLDYASLAALGDAFILRLLQMRGRMAPMSTVTLTTYFHATEAELAAQGTAPLVGVADASRIAANFHDQQMQLFGSGGGLLASGIQTVWYAE
jgi:hypothetical protein